MLFFGASKELLADTSLFLPEKAGSCVEGFRNEISVDTFSELALGKNEVKRTA